MCREPTVAQKKEKGHGSGISSAEGPLEKGKVVDFISVLCDGPLDVRLVEPRNAVRGE